MSNFFSLATVAANDPRSDGPPEFTQPMAIRLCTGAGEPSPGLPRTGTGSHPPCLQRRLDGIGNLYSTAERPPGCGATGPPSPPPQQTAKTAAVLVASAFFVLLSSPRVVASVQLTLSGTAITRKYAQSGQLYEWPKVSFEMQISDSQWLLTYIRDTQPAQPRAVDWEVVSFDGEYIYYLLNMQSGYDNQKRLGVELGPNVATASVYKGSIYNSEEDPEVGPIWLAYASGYYHHRQEDDLVEPAFESDGLGWHYGPPEHRQVRARWQLSDLVPYFPIHVAYLSDGSTKGPQGPKMLPPPYNQGFTSAVYQVQAFTNIAGMTIPLASKLSMFTPRPSPEGADRLLLTAEYHIYLTSATPSVKVFRFQPDLPGITMVRDDRYPRFTHHYLITNRWVSEKELSTNDYFLSYRKANTALRQRLPSWARFAFIVVVAAPLVIGCALACARLRRRQSHRSEYS